MTVEEKRDVVRNYCGMSHCDECVLENKGITEDGTHCINIVSANEEELDRALALIIGNASAEFIGCEYCKHMSKGEAEPPCLYCKHNKEFGTEEYMTAPEYYEPQDAPAGKGSGDRTVVKVDGAWEKKYKIQTHCSRLGLTCDGCSLHNYDWRHRTGVGCLDLVNADEDELDEALRLIGKAGEVLPVRVADGLKSPVEIIQLEVGDGSVMSVANAICKHYVQYSDTEKGLIDLDELTEHIDAYVRAERKALEYKKMDEED